MKKFLKILAIIPIFLGMIYAMIYFQYNFWHHFRDRNPIPENEILKNSEKNFEISEKNILEKIPSNKNIFTQGIFVNNNKIFMSSGNPHNFPNTKTQFGVLENSNFEPKIIIDDTNFFGEWSVIFDEKIFWTFWKNRKIFIFDQKNFEKIGEIDIPGEGWGLATDGESLILSDGSEFLTFFDKNLKITKRIAVTENWKKIIRLNELEYIDNKIFANIWLTNDIVIIEPKTGEVVARKNFDFLKNLELSNNPQAQEMNGIAFNKEKNEIILTGKMWGNLYIFDKKIFEK